MDRPGTTRNHADLSSSPPHRAGKKARVDDYELGLSDDDSFSSDFFDDLFHNTQDYCMPVSPAFASSSSSRAGHSIAARPTKPLPKRVVASSSRGIEPNFATIDNNLARIRASLNTMRRAAADHDPEWFPLPRHVQ